MIQRDIADLVRSCLEDRRHARAPVRKPKANIIDTLLQDEIQSFTSVEFDEQRHAAADGAGRRWRPTRPWRMPPMASGEFIDPRSWADDTGMNAPPAAAGPGR